jgi:hypothetical protein
MSAEPRGLIESDAAAILPLDALLFLHTLLSLVGSAVGTDPLDRSLLDEAYDVTARTDAEVAPVDDLLGALERAGLMRREAASWRFSRS